ncbi:hypothetical protein AB0J82_36075 [Asanoa sp. NPDC049518]|uniref:hypothetical protein n=1 Tax=unclassified Asanoa TaxID=2685164 RepID=UPI00341DEE24
MRRAGLGALLLTWLYGVPFLLVVGFVRRTSKPYMETHAQARAFGATTDTVLVTALVLNVALPAAGMLLAVLLRDAAWTRQFAWALGGMALIYLAVSLAADAATAPLIGWTPADQEPAPAVTRCIPISGGRGCPGG